MKTTIIIILTLGLAFIVFQSFISRSSHKTEQQKYSVIEKTENFEIRFYPQAILATVDMKENNYKASANKGFRTLASYIFGGNTANKSISMTAPVQMHFSDSSSTMSFVMPSKYSMDQLPSPHNSSVKLRHSEDEYVAAIRYGGYSSDRDIRQYTAMLKSELEKKNIKAIGPFRYLGYNPPYEILGRRNEIIVKIEYPY